MADESTAPTPSIFQRAKDYAGENWSAVKALAGIAPVALGGLIVVPAGAAAGVAWFVARRKKNKK